MRIFVRIILSLLMLFFASIHYDYNVFAVNEFPAIPIEFNGSITLNNKPMPNNSIVYLYSNDIQENMLLATGIVINGMYFGINEKVSLYFTQSNIKNVIFKYSLPNSNNILGDYRYTIDRNKNNIVLDLVFTNNDISSFNNANINSNVNQNILPSTITSGGGGGGGTRILSNNKINTNTGSVNNSLQKNQINSVGGGTLNINNAKSNEYQSTILYDINDHWSKDIVLQALDQNIVSGYNDSTFKPDNPITRAELLKIIFNAKGIEPTKDISDKPFNDVGLGYWDTGYIARAKDLGIVSGYNNNIFKPKGLVNRAEGLKMILTAFNKNVNDNANNIFNDVSNDAWYAKFVNKAYEDNLVRGYDGNLFKPENNITRAEALKIIMQIKNLNNNDEKK